MFHLNFFFFFKIEMNIAIMEESDMDYVEISEEIEDENEDEVENDELITATLVESGPKEEL
jgi:hypothetical protein